MDRISSLQFFVRVVESGSFSQAARELGVGQPAVSKQIAALEKRLGAQLLNRTSRGLRPTPSGIELYEDAILVLRYLDDAESRVANAQQRPKGSVRVAAPPVLTSMMIVPELPKFFDEFPDVSIELVVSERYADLIQEGLDLALRVGSLDDSSLVARHIGHMQLAAVGSPSYFAKHGVPLHPSDLVGHQLVTNRHLGEVSNWRFGGSAPALLKPVAGQFSCNNPSDMHAAVLAGLGIAQSARGLFENELRAGLVTEVLSDFTPDPLPIHMLYVGPRISHRVRVVSDFLQQCIQCQPNLRL
jgi:LysR family transcriptional regulator for bpeEF and oprC